MKLDRHQLRDARTLTQRTLFEVAEAVGLGRAELSKIENGFTAEPDPNVLDKLKAYFLAAGVIFNENGRAELRPGFQKIAGQKVN